MSEGQLEDATSTDAACAIDIPKACHPVVGTDLGSDQVAATIVNQGIAGCGGQGFCELRVSTVGANLADVSEVGRKCDIGECGQGCSCRGELDAGEGYIVECGSKPAGAESRRHVVDLNVDIGARVGVGEYRDVRGQQAIVITWHISWSNG